MAFAPFQTVNALESFQIVQTATIHVEDVAKWQNDSCARR